MMTSQRGACISRTVQEKTEIDAKNIDKELAMIQADFFHGVQAQTNYNIQWDTLDLSQVADKKEQLERIKEWGKLKVC